MDSVVPSPMPGCADISGLLWGMGESKGARLEHHIAMELEAGINGGIRMTDAEIIQRVKDGLNRQKLFIALECVKFLEKENEQLKAQIEKMKKGEVKE